MQQKGFWQHAQEHPDALAVVDPDERHVSAGELLGDANRIVHGLRSLGLGAGDSIAMVLPNTVEALALYMAATQAGMYLVPINYRLAGPEVAYIVNDSAAKAVFVHERFAEAAVAATKELEACEHRFSLGEVPGFEPFSALIDGQPDSLPQDRRAGAAMHYTSGTTGRPKGVRRQLPDVTPDELATAGTGVLQMFGIKPYDDNVHITGSPLYHTAVLAFATSSLHMGHTVVLMDKWTPQRMLELIERYRVTTSHMVPTQFNRLLALPKEEREQYDVSSLRHMIHAAAPCPVEIKRQMIQWWGNTIDEYYAASEGGGTLVTAEEWMERPGTVGKAWPGAEIRIYDDDGNQLPANELGTVYMKLPEGRGFEYHNAPEKTRDNRIGNFFTVGDVGFLDEDGYLFLRDRKTDMIISGGVNIYPAEIEAELTMHPKVVDVAVFGIPDDDWGEQVKAVVETVPGVEGGPEVEKEILDDCRERLAKYKLPRSIDFVDELPRDPNGKLYKRKLRDPYWEGRQASI